MLGLVCDQLALQQSVCWINGDQPYACPSHQLHRPRSDGSEAAQGSVRRWDCYFGSTLTSTNFKSHPNQRDIAQSNGELAWSRYPWLLGAKLLINFCHRCEQYPTLSGIDGSGRRKALLEYNNGLFETSRGAIRCCSVSQPATATRTFQFDGTTRISVYSQPPSVLPLSCCCRTSTSTVGYRIQLQMRSQQPVRQASSYRSLQYEI